MPNSAFGGHRWIDDLEPHRQFGEPRPVSWPVRGQAWKASRSQDGPLVKPEPHLGADPPVRDLAARARDRWEDRADEAGPAGRTNRTRRPRWRAGPIDTLRSIVVPRSPWASSGATEIQDAGERRWRRHPRPRRPLRGSCTLLTLKAAGRCG